MLPAILFPCHFLRASGMRRVVWLPVPARLQGLSLNPAGRNPFMNCVLTCPDMHQPLSMDGWEPWSSSGVHLQTLRTRRGC